MGRTRQLTRTLTSRQREVLDLIARGHTNGEIAEKLGISLAGAKWHVSDLMGKFGCESRDELAESWERERGLSRRLGGWFRALMGGSVLKVVGGTAGVAVVAGVTGLAYVGFRGGEDSAGVRSASEAALIHAPTPTPTPAPTLSPPDAERIVRESLQRQIDDVGLGLEVTAAGHPISESDFELVLAHYYHQTTSIPDSPIGEMTFSPGPYNTWLVHLRARNTSAEALNGEINAVATLRDDQPLVGMRLWGPPASSPQRLLSGDLSPEYPLLQTVSGGTTFTVSVVKTLEGWTVLESFEPSPTEFRSGNRGPGFGDLVAGKQLLVSGLSERDGFGHALAFVSDDVATVRFTTEDGRTMTLEPQSAPPGTPFPWRAVMAAFPGSAWVTLVEALDADGNVLAAWDNSNHPVNPPR